MYENLKIEKSIFFLHTNVNFSIGSFSLGDRPALLQSWFYRWSSALNHSVQLTVII